jgi:hypothetical protein
VAQTPYQNSRKEAVGHDASAKGVAGGRNWPIMAGKDMGKGGKECW